MKASAPSLRRVTPAASALLVVAAGAWIGVVVVARNMSSMPGTMGLGIGSFVAVWVLMMTAMMLPSVIPFASLYANFDEGARCSPGGIRRRLFGRLEPRRRARLLVGLGLGPVGGQSSFHRDGLRRGHFRRLRRLSTDPVQRPVPCPLPLTAGVCLEVWFVPGTHARRAGRSLPRGVLPRLLLGAHGTSHCVRADEPGRHGGTGRRCSRREGSRLGSGFQQGARHRCARPGRRGDLRATAGTWAPACRPHGQDGTHVTWTRTPFTADVAAV